MRLAEAEVAMHGHVASGATDENAQALEEKFGKEAVAAAGGAVATGTTDDSAVCGKLFSGMVFWLAREVPREVWCRPYVKRTPFFLFVLFFCTIFHLYSTITFASVRLHGLQH